MSVNANDVVCEHVKLSRSIADRKKEMTINAKCHRLVEKNLTASLTKLSRLINNLTKWSRQRKSIQIYVKCHFVNFPDQWTTAGAVAKSLIYIECVSCGHTAMATVALQLKWFLCVARELFRRCDIKCFSRNIFPVIFIAFLFQFASLYIDTFVKSFYVNHKINIANNNTNKWQNIFIFLSISHTNDMK